MILKFERPKAKTEPPAGAQYPAGGMRHELLETADLAPSKRDEAMSLLGREVEYLVRKAVFIAREHGARREVYLLFLSAVRTIRNNLFKRLAP